MPSLVDLAKLTVKGLKAELTKYKLDTRGRKSVLLARLVDHIQISDEEDEDTEEDVEDNEDVCEEGTSTELTASEKNVADQPESDCQKAAEFEDPDLEKLLTGDDVQTTTQKNTVDDTIQPMSTENAKEVTDERHEENMQTDANDGDTKKNNECDSVDDVKADILDNCAKKKNIDNDKVEHDRTKADRSPNTEIFSEPPNVNIADDPQNTVVVDEPKDTAVVDEPQNTAVVDEPQNTAVVDEPPNTAVVDEPQSTAVVDDPPTTAVADEPENTVVVDEPSDTAVVDRPPDSAVVDKPQNIAVVDEPPNIAVVDEPPTTPVVDEPEKTEVVDKHSTAAVDNEPSTPLLVDKDDNIDKTEHLPVTAVVDGTPNTTVLDKAPDETVPDEAPNTAVVAEHVEPLHTAIPVEVDKLSSDNSQQISTQKEQLNTENAASMEGVEQKEELVNDEAKSEEDMGFSEPEYLTETEEEKAERLKIKAVTITDAVLKPLTSEYLVREVSNCRQNKVLIVSPISLTQLTTPVFSDILSKCCAHKFNSTPSSKSIAEGTGHLQLTFPTETLMAECEKILNENSFDVSISSLVGAEGKTGRDKIMLEITGDPGLAMGQAKHMVCIIGAPESITEEQLLEKFPGFIALITKSDSDKPWKGFVEFQTKEEAELAVETNKNLVIENHKLESFLVNYAPVSNTEQKKDYQIVFPLVVHKIQSLVKECIAIRSTISSQMRDVPKSRRLLLELSQIENQLVQDETFKEERCLPGASYCRSYFSEKMQQHLEILDKKFHDQAQMAIEDIQENVDKFEADLAKKQSQRSSRQPSKDNKQNTRDNRKDTEPDFRGSRGRSERSRRSPERRISDSRRSDRRRSDRRVSSERDSSSPDYRRSNKHKESDRNRKNYKRSRHRSSSESDHSSPEIRQRSRQRSKDRNRRDTQNRRRRRSSERRSSSPEIRRRSRRSRSKERYADRNRKDTQNRRRRRSSERRSSSPEFRRKSRDGFKGRQDKGRQDDRNRGDSKRYKRDNYRRSSESDDSIQTNRKQSKESRFVSMGEGKRSNKRANLGQSSESDDSSPEYKQPSRDRSLQYTEHRVVHREKPQLDDRREKEMFSTKRSASRFDSDNESGPKIARRDSYGMSSAEPRQRSPDKPVMSIDELLVVLDQHQQKHAARKYGSGYSDDRPSRRSPSPPNIQASKLVEELIHKREVKNPERRQERVEHYEERTAHRRDEYRSNYRAPEKTDRRSPGNKTMTVNELKKLVESRKAEREAATRAAKTAAIPGLSYLLEESKKRTEPTDSPIRYNAYQEDTVKRSPDIKNPPDTSVNDFQKMLEICQARKLAETKQQTQGRKATASSTSYLEREVDRKPQANYTPDYRTSDKYGERSTSRQYEKSSTRSESHSKSQLYNPFDNVSHHERSDSSSALRQEPAPYSAYQQPASSRTSDSKAGNNRYGDSTGSQRPGSAYQHSSQSRNPYESQPPPSLQDQWAAYYQSMQQYGGGSQPPPPQHQVGYPPPAYGQHQPPPHPSTQQPPPNYSYGYKRY